MLRRAMALGLFACLLACLLRPAAMAHAQAAPTAAPQSFLQLGVGYTYARAAYDPGAIQGVSGFADFDFTPNWGVEAGFHYIALVTPTDIAENSVVAGPRYVYRRGRFAPYAKAVAGIGDMTVEEWQDNQGKSSGRFLVYGFGGGLDIIASRRFVLRAIDLEYQRWPNLGGGISPVVLTSGFAYRFR